MIELEGLHAAICWHWHRINVDEHVPLLEGEERLPRHPAPTDFGGTTLAVLARPVRLEALTAAGRRLYELGGRAARLEHERLILRVLTARRELDDARAAMTRIERAALVTAALQAAEAAKHRDARESVTPVSSDAWPVRTPGRPHRAESEQTSPRSPAESGQREGEKRVRSTTGSVRGRCLKLTMNGWKR
ncbi:hypothetical protein [Plantibacter sp. CFBP 8775]|uniref:hypothetical protein n=1 Tax=Plantibacter sp. CFBP 8775 TaxID=2774038 RepID=UPI0017874A3B|nr:hypothetical protein [Plantibacter sp. CFBP 8775]MBD8104773.1 hypothetical protein [Plantibacter sp. CFBP 8775]